LRTIDNSLQLLWLTCVSSTENFLYSDEQRCVSLYCPWEIAGLATTTSMCKASSCYTNIGLLLRCSTTLLLTTSWVLSLPFNQWRLTRSHSSIQLGNPVQRLEWPTALTGRLSPCCRCPCKRPDACRRPGLHIRKGKPYA
jgi:hypothetical protein